MNIGNDECFKAPKNPCFDEELSNEKNNMQISLQCILIVIPLRNTVK